MRLLFWEDSLGRTGIMGRASSVHEVLIQLKLAKHYTITGLILVPISTLRSKLVKAQLSVFANDFASDSPVVWGVFRTILFTPQTRFITWDFKCWASRTRSPAGESVSVWSALKWTSHTTRSEEKIWHYLSFVECVVSKSVKIWRITECVRALSWNTTQIDPFWINEIIFKPVMLLVWRVMQRVQVAWYGVNCRPDFLLDAERCTCFSPRQTTVIDALFMTEVVQVQQLCLVFFNNLKKKEKEEQFHFDSPELISCWK